MTEYQTLEHDVLVIGAGGAGLSAAVKASAATAKAALKSVAVVASPTSKVAAVGIATVTLTLTPSGREFAGN